MPIMIDWLYFNKYVAWISFNHINISPLPVKTWHLSCLYFTLMTIKRGVILLIPRLVYHETSVIPLSSDEPAHLIVSCKKKTWGTENLSILELPTDWSWRIYLVLERRFHSISKYSLEKLTNRVNAARVYGTLIQFFVQKFIWQIQQYPAWCGEKKIEQFIKTMYDLHIPVHINEPLTQTWCILSCYCGLGIFEKWQILHKYAFIFCSMNFLQCLI